MLWLLKDFFVIIFAATIILCWITKVKNNIFPSQGIQSLCQITEYRVVEVVFYIKVLVNDILVGLERILDYARVRLDRFDFSVQRRKEGLGG